MHIINVSHEPSGSSVVFKFSLILPKPNQRLSNLADKVNKRIAGDSYKKFREGIEIRHELKLGRFSMFMCRFLPDKLIVDLLYEYAMINLIRRMIA